MDTQKADELKGRVKEGVGAFTGDRDLEREGKADQVEAGAKDKINDIAEGAEDTVDKLRDKL